MKVKFFILLTVFSLFFVGCVSKVQEVSIDPTEVTLNINETKQFRATVTPGEADQGIVWSIDKPEVVSVVDGLVTALSAGEATVTAKSTQDVSKSASAKIVVNQNYPSSFNITTADVLLTNITQTTLDLKVFSSADALLNKINLCFPVAQAVTNFNDVEIVKFTAEDNSIINIANIFVENQVINETKIGTVIKVTGLSPDTTYTNKFSLIVNANGKEITINWDGTETTVTTTALGKINIESTDVVISNSADTSFKVSLKNLQAKLTAAGLTATGNAVFTVKGLAADKVINVAVSNDIGENITGLTVGYNYTLTFTLTIGGIDAGDILGVAAITKIVKGPVSVDVSPMEISLSRKSSLTGEPEAKGLAIFSRPDMHFVFKDALGDDYATEYDINESTWSASFVDKDAVDTVLGSFTNKKYLDKAEFNLPLDKIYNLQLKSGSIKIPKVGNPDDITIFNLNWVADAVMNDYTPINNTKEFAATMSFSDNWDIAYDDSLPNKLVFRDGDDFNYNFSGLDYKSYDSYNAVKNDANADYRANNFHRMWNARVQTHSYSRVSACWDMRGIEVKNSKMLCKTMMMNRDKGAIYLKPNSEKELTGFTDLYRGSFQNNGNSAITTVIKYTDKTNPKNAELTSGEYGDYQFGYVETKVRMKTKAYNDSNVNAAWYAFWTNGTVEFDIMEWYTGGRMTHFDHGTTHWHNKNYSNKTTIGLGVDLPGTNPEGAAFDTNNDWWVLGCLWTPKGFTYYLNGKKSHVVTYDPARPDNIRAFKRVSYNKDGSQSGQATGTVNNAQPNAVPQDFMSMLYTCEAGNPGWTGATLGGNLYKLPTWMEIEYFVYYPLDSTIESITVTKESDKTLIAGETVQLNSEVAPSYAANKKVTWSSDNEAIARVDENGLVTAVGSGTVIITATSQQTPTVSGTATVKVINLSEVKKVTSITLNPAAKTVNATQLPQTFTITKTVQPTDATNGDVTWSSSNENIARVVDGEVTVISRGNGSVTITATAVDGSGITGTCDITINNDRPRAPETLTKGTTTYTKLVSYEFDAAETNVKVTSESAPLFELANGVLRSKSDISARQFIDFENIPDNTSFVLVRMKYNNANMKAFWIDRKDTIYAGGSNFKYAFIMPNDQCFIHTNWNNGYQATGWTNNTAFQDYGIFANGEGEFKFYRFDQNFSTAAEKAYTNRNAPKWTAFTAKSKMVTLSFDVGSGNGVEIEYVGFYSGGPVITPPVVVDYTTPPETLTVKDVELTKQQVYDFSNTTGITMDAGFEKKADGTISNNVQLSGAKYIRFPVANAFKYALVRMKYNDNWQPNMIFQSPSNVKYQFLRENSVVATCIAWNSNRTSGASWGGSTDGNYHVYGIYNNAGDGGYDRDGKNYTAVVPSFTLADYPLNAGDYSIRVESHSGTLAANNLTIDYIAFYN